MRVKWLRQALLDLDEIATYINADSPAIAAKVVVNIITAVSLLREQQGIGRAGRVPGTKELLVTGLPYIVPYRVKDETVQILRVYHTSRKWPNRL
ncbi:MAG: type II toxin-antitoxin system mRNA interferase toxin, RelE/StbE family [Deltaproteobacteria bacterium CG23_combo_of_CG06-09_8_20_14_all_60_8]|nr:MAG: toxin Y4kP [Desulfobacterales bacterium CG2_30_60_27]PIP43583.1 MAG: type II toxin-antitoxin system mRNA interferase toxin, RelE/StbE family [Deltaproteobacteria bacterium CG23_combo_of_CG06-09_8_20_14_all_60_8]